MITLTHQEALESLFSPITLGEKDFMLSQNEFNLLFAELQDIYVIDAVHVYSDKTENRLALKKFIQNACYNSYTTIKTHNMAAPEIEYSVLVKPVLGDLRVGIKSGSVFSDGETKVKEGELTNAPVFNKNELQIVRVMRSTKSGTEITGNKLEIHIFIPRFRMSSFGVPKTYAPISLKESEIK